MADEPVIAPAAEPTQGNAPEARTPQGEIKDQQATSQTTQSETKTPETKPPETKPEGDKKPEAGPPEKYDFKAPDGFELDSKAIEAATPVFKELGLTNEQGQKLFDVYQKLTVEAIEAPYKAYESLRSGWRDEIAKNSTLGNGSDGLSDSARANIARAIDSVGDAKAQTALKEALDITGAGDNPAIVAAFNALGKLLSEGTAVRAGAPAPVKVPNAGPKSAANALYPNLNSSANS